jgi:putative transposase
MAETLTIVHLDVPPTLARTLRSTCPIESMISIWRDHAASPGFHEHRCILLS